MCITLQFVVGCPTNASDSGPRQDLGCLHGATELYSWFECLCITYYQSINQSIIQAKALSPVQGVAKKGICKFMKELRILKGFVA